MATSNAILTRSSNNANRNNTKATPETNEFDGGWINVGFETTVKDADGVEKDIRVNLPLGIPVASLKDRKIYDSTGAEYAASSHQLNQIMEIIRTTFGTLQPGDALDMPLLSVQLYRRQEEAAPAEKPAMNNKALTAALFGVQTED